MLLKNPLKSSAQWCTVLDVGQRWQAPFLRDTAIAHLAKSQLNVSARLAISTKYGVTDWLQDILPDLCLQTFLPPDDIALLPPTLIVAFFQARERFRSHLTNMVLSFELCLVGGCLWSSPFRDRIYRILEQSLSCPTQPTQSTVIQEFTKQASRNSNCPYCASRQRSMLSECEAFGRLYVWKLCFPNVRRLVRASGPGL